MVSTTYLLVVVVVALAAAGLWCTKFRVTAHAGLAGRDRQALEGVGAAGGRFDAAGWLTALAGAPDQAGGDLVERMAQCLVEGTRRFGTRFAVPRFLGVMLPQELFAAAVSLQPQLSAEVVARFVAVMTDRARRGRAGQGFELPAGYGLRLVLTCGPREAMLAAFEPIIDVHAALGDTPAAPAGPRPAPPAAPPAASSPAASAASAAGEGVVTGVVAASPVTRVKKLPAGVRQGGGRVVLAVDGTPRAERRLGGGLACVLVIGRTKGADLRCPDSVSEVSRVHAELTWAHGRSWIEDKNSSNGTWIQKPDGAPQRLNPGSPVPLERGDTVWLDEDHHATVSYR